LDNPNICTHGSWDKVNAESVTAVIESAQQLHYEHLMPVVRAEDMNASLVAQALGTAGFLWHWSRIHAVNIGGKAGRKSTLAKIRHHNDRI
jgi:hypothetical protein